MQWKLNLQKKFTEEDEKQSLKSFFGLWIVLPILIYFSFICAEYEILAGLFDGTYQKSRLGLGLWQITVICLELGLFITFIGYKKMIKYYSFFFLGIGVSTICCGFFVLARLHLFQAPNVGLLEFEEVPEAEDLQEMVDENFFTIAGLLLNVITVVVFSVCNWVEKTGEKEEKINYFWNFEVYSEWILNCLWISVFLSFAPLFSTLAVQMTQTVIPDAFIAAFLGCYLALFGMYSISHYKKNNFIDVDDNSIYDCTV